MFSSVLHYAGKGNLPSLRWPNWGYLNRSVICRMKKSVKNGISYCFQDPGFYLYSYFMAFLYIMILDEYVGLYSQNEACMSL